MAPRKQSGKAGLAAQLRAVGLRYPGAHLKSPWPGHLDLAVRDLTFAFLSVDGDPFSISCKLPLSRSIALSLRGAIPTPYGLGKSGWVSLSSELGAEIPPIGLLTAWLEESYRAQAPKKLVAELDGAVSRPTSVRRAQAPGRQRARAKR